MMASVIALISATPASGAASPPTGAAGGLSHQARESTAVSPRVAPVHCPPGSKRAGAGCIDKHPVLICKSAQQAVRFYAGRIVYWRSKMGAGTSSAEGKHEAKAACPRYLAHVLQRKAYTAHRAYERWLKDEWHYERWMPAWMIRLAQCEMGLDWHRRWGAYEGAFAFATTTWDGYKLPGYPNSAADASPRQQMNVVYRVARAVGGVGAAWGCWRGPQHAWVRGGLPESGFYG